jgi:CRP-like cAMP-binding protein
MRQQRGRRGCRRPVLEAHVVDVSAEQLAGLPLFASMTEPARRDLAARFEVEQHTAGHVVLHQGQAGYAFYVVAQGVLAVTERDQLLRQLGPGDHFGEIAIMGNGRRTAAVTATTDVTLWALFGTQFRELEAANADVAEMLRQTMQERLNSD